MYSGGMHPSTERILRFFDHEHLPEDLRLYPAEIRRIASRAASELDGPELTAGLRKLLEAKDCLVRAVIEKRDSEDVTRKLE